MSTATNKLGQEGERLAQRFVKKLGYQIVDANFRTRYGEIDLIASERDKLHFIEVKTRTSNIKGAPYESVTPRKVNHLQKAVHIFLLQKDFKGYKLSLDVISIEYCPPSFSPSLRYFENIQ